MGILRASEYVQGSRACMVDGYGRGFKSMSGEFQVENRKRKQKDAALFLAHSARLT